MSWFKVYRHVCACALLPYTGWDQAAHAFVVPRVAIQLLRREFVTLLNVDNDPTLIGHSVLQQLSDVSVTAWHSTVHAHFTLPHTCSKVPGYMMSIGGAKSSARSTFRLRATLVPSASRQGDISRQHQCGLKQAHVRKRASSALKSRRDCRYVSRTLLDALDEAKGCARPSPSSSTPRTGAIGSRTAASIAASSSSCGALGLDAGGLVVAALVAAGFVAGTVVVVTAGLAVDGAVVRRFLGCEARGASSSLEEPSESLEASRVRLRDAATAAARLCGLPLPLLLARELRCT